MKSILESLSISLQEIFTVIIPGAVMCFCIVLIFADRSTTYEHFHRWTNDWFTGVILFFASYFVGYLIYILGSKLDAQYDRIKRRVLGLDKDFAEDKSQTFTEKDSERTIIHITEMAKESILQDQTKLEKVVAWFLPHLVDTHNLIVEVVKVMSLHGIPKELGGYKHQVLNAFQYSYRRLMVENELMFAEVERYYRTARFFRSMAIVFAVGGFISLLRIVGFQWCLLGFGIGWLLLVFLTFWIYLDRWRKTTHVAYKNVLVVEGLKK